MGNKLILPLLPFFIVIVDEGLLPVFIDMSLSPKDCTTSADTVVALTDVKAPVACVVSPILVPSIAPPSMSTASLA